MMSNRGFSLIELSVVLVIIAITAGAVGLGVAAHRGRSDCERLVSDLSAFDKQCRVSATQTGRPLLVTFDLGRGRIERIDDQGRPAGTAMSLPQGCRIRKLLLAEECLSDGGSVGLSYSRLGMSPSYAIRFESSGAAPRWLLVCGATGCVVQVKDEDEAKTILAMEKPSRDDAR